MTWDKAYGFNPRASVPPLLRSKVLGGHGEMWGRAPGVLCLWCLHDALTCAEAPFAPRIGRTRGVVAPRDVSHAVHAGETVDASDFDSTVWPRLAAIGERLWSSVDDVDAARPRLENFRCLLLERGVGAAPLNNSMARTAPVGPGACTQRRRRI